eukprot:6061704-Alexandrium_andersonii.AAC.1
MSVAGPRVPARDWPAGRLTKPQASSPLRAMDTRSAVPPASFTALVSQSVRRFHSPPVRANTFARPLRK